MLVRDIMNRDVMTLDRNATLKDAIFMMNSHRFRRIPVVTDGKLEGIITDRDIRQALNSPVIFHERSADDYLLNTVTIGSSMTHDPLTIGPDETVLLAAEIMEEKKIGGLPVVSEGGLVGIITLSDLIKCLIRDLRASEGKDGA